MAGCRFLRHRDGRFTITVSAALLLCIGRAYAENTSDLFDANAGGLATAMATGPEAGCCDCCCCPDGLGICETITESIFGQPDPCCWYPLPFFTLFSEGW